VNILLAEDSTLLREGLAGLLRAAGHEVTTVADADALVRAVPGDRGRRAAS
jgi:DNA-binding response OmpR family regulator